MSAARLLRCCATLALAGCAPANLPAGDASALDAATSDASGGDAPPSDAGSDEAPRDASASDAASYPRDANTPGWQLDAPLPIPRQEIGAALARGLVWVPGGFEGLRAVRTVRTFDPRAHTWSTGPELPSARHHAPVVAVGDDVYLLGGQTGLDFAPIAECLVLRAGSDRWEPIAPLPTPRGAGAAVVLDGVIYLAAGAEPGATLARATLAYDPRTNRWSERAPIPTPREHVAGFALAGRFYVAGGRSFSLTSNVATVEAYDPRTDAWSSVAPLPTARGGLAAAVLDGRAYLTGGEQPAFAFDTVEVFDGTSWSAPTRIPTPRHGHASFAFERYVYVLGGGDRPLFAATSALERFAP